jgi:nucleoside-diphosphate-sugar epimerase
MRVLLVAGPYRLSRRSGDPLQSRAGRIDTWHQRLLLGRPDSSEADSCKECSNRVLWRAALTARNRPDIPGVDWRALSQLDRSEQWPDLMANTDVVVHLAALAHQTGRAAQGRWQEFRRVNVHGTRVVAQACRDAGIRRLVFVSSIGVYARSAAPIDEQTAMHPQDDYGRSKLEAEAALRSELSGSATDWCILRAPPVYGRGSPRNMPRLPSLVASGFPLPFGGIRNRRSFISWTIWPMPS